VSNDPAFRFCGGCGSPLGEIVVPPAATAAPPVAERRLVSVLFADLVGFTSLSEHRDAEEVRELLTRYFEVSRQIVTRYGGTVEKFIGDAVMAVWGAPVAQEDDAERAVRAGLELTEAVSALGAEVGAPDLQARAGVTTGEAAVTLGASGQGMVAGDLVNTASRVQSAADPGTVFVGDRTRRATEAAVVYEDAGAHDLKGKAEPVALFRAVRVVGGRGGSLRSTGLEAPFVGRDPELRLIKQVLHSTAEEHRAHLVSVVGIAGIGKSRLSWELFKYVDGLADVLLWHRGRCLAYGDGVAYWALAEMVRGRAGILEDEPPGAALGKLREVLASSIPDPEERRWLEPRLAQLLALEDVERTSPDRADLFSAWRLFFERLAEQTPVILVFEDLQWADEALLDFIEYLLEWSRSHPLFVLTLARPELTERRPTWGAGKRNFTSQYLEPLSNDAMAELLSGLVPGLPADLRDRILDRAEGVPLYAVETVRMLIDQGRLRQEGSRYLPTAPVDQLEVPETLQALISARLDGLPPDERRLLQRASVLGKTFSLAAVDALAADPNATEQVLAGLVRKEFLTLHADPRSPERGQYGFLQDLVRKVAYETLAKRDRKALHLAAAAWLESSWSADEGEVAEVVASHYLEAYLAAGEGPDAGAIRTKACDALVRAGERAGSLAAQVEALRYFHRAAELTDDATTRAGLLERAGSMARIASRTDEAMPLFEESERLFLSAGLTHRAARVSARIGELLWWGPGKIEEAIARMERSFEVLANEEADESLATLAAELARLQFFAGHIDRAAERVEFALQAAETLWLPAVLSEGLNTKHLILSARNRPEESLAVLERALAIALENDEPTAATRAFANLSNGMLERDRIDDALSYQRRGLELSARLGFRGSWGFLQGHLATSMWLRGDWDEAVAAFEAMDDPESSADALVSAGVASTGMIPLFLARGELERARDLLRVWAGGEESADVQARASALAAFAAVRLAEGDAEAARRGAREAFDLGFAVALGDLTGPEEVLSVVEAHPLGLLAPLLRAQASRYRARLNAARGLPDGVEAGYKTAAGMLREMGSPFFLAVVQAEHGTWLSGQGRLDDAAGPLHEARATFQRLGARANLDALDRTASGVMA
jgi:class 3 adenylate cyclase/tetratricopeptide (TPR) repeat protein